MSCQEWCLGFHYFIILQKKNLNIIDKKHIIHFMGLSAVFSEKIQSVRLTSNVALIQP